MKSIAAAALIAAGSSFAHAQQVTISITNEVDAGGFSFTPLWGAFHDGSFDVYNSGEPASNFPGLEALAEEGSTGDISASFAGSSAGLAGGVDTTLVSPNAAPPFTPGESGSFTVNVGDASVNRYFSYASMVVPTNDLFFANGNPFAHEIFDASGNFTGPVTIQIFGSDVLDAGTEVNDAFGGAAFSTNGGAGADEGGLISSFFSDPNASDYLDSFLGTGTPDGGTINAAFGRDTLLATITVTPSPSTAGLLAMGGLIAARRRR